MLKCFAHLYKFRKHSLARFVEVPPVDILAKGQHAVSLEELWVGPARGESRRADSYRLQDTTGTELFHRSLGLKPEHGKQCLLISCLYKDHIERFVSKTPQARAAPLLWWAQTWRWLAVFVKIYVSTTPTLDHLKLPLVQMRREMT